MPITEEQNKTKHEEDLERLRNFCLMDDDFMTAFFRDNIEDTEYVLRVILDMQDIKVSSVHVQHVLKNLSGRSVRLDVHAVLEDGRETDIEIQRDDRGSGFKRARENSSLLDASILKAGQDTEKLPETYVIFITENDVIGLDEPIYPIDRYVSVKGKYIPVDDGAHIIYVNGAKKGNATEIERLMHDFSCKNADDMYSEQLAKTMRYFKETDEGVKTVGRFRDEIENETREEIALNMIEIGTLSLDDIADVTELSLERVQELAGVKGA